jgi:hypothetical protein
VGGKVGFWTPFFSRRFLRLKEAPFVAFLALGKGPPLPGPFWTFWTFLDVSGRFGTCLDISGLFLDVSGHFWTFLDFGAFLDISELSRTYWHITGHFWRFLDISCFSWALRQFEIARLVNIRP